MLFSQDSPKEKPPKLVGGPMGLGDPDDRKLRKVEKDIIIRNRMEEEATKRCSETLNKFLECAKREGFMVLFRCRKESEINNDCKLRYLEDPKFEEEVTNKYLEARSHYRRTGEPLEKYERKRVKSSFC